MLFLRFIIKAGATTRNNYYDYRLQEILLKERPLSILATIKRSTNRTKYCCTGCHRCQCFFGNWSVVFVDICLVQNDQSNLIKASKEYS